MPNETIDTLELRVESDSNKAIQSLKDMKSLLGDIGQALSAIKTGNLSQLGNLASGVKTATKSVADLKKNAENIVVAPKVDLKQLDKGKSQMSGLQKSAESVQKSMSKGFEIKIDRGGATRDLNYYKNELAEIKETVKSLGSGSTGQSIISDNLKTSISELKTDFPRATELIRKFEDELAKLGTTQGMSGVSNGVKQVKTDVDSMIDSMQAKFQKLGTDFKFTGTGEQLRKAIDETSKQLDALFLKEKELISSGKTDTTAFVNVQRGIAETTNKFEILSEKQKEYEAFQKRLSGLSIPPINEANIRKLESTLNRTEANLDKFRAKLSNDIQMGRITASIDDSGYRKAQEQISLTQQTVEALRSRISDLNAKAGNTGALGAFRKALSNISTVGGKVKKGLSGIVSMFSKVASGVSSAASRIKSFGKALTGMNSANAKSDFSFKKALNTVLKYGFGIRSLYFAFRRLRSAISEGFQNLSQYSSEMNGTLTSLSSSLLVLKNALAVAFAPIVTAVAPYIQAFLDMMISALNMVGRFIAALTGKGMAVQAKKVTKSYSGSISGVGDSAKGAAKDVKKLNKELSVLAFDELNQLTKPSETGNAGGGAGGGGTGGAGGLTGADMFETVPIEGKLKDLANTLRDFFKNEDWEGLGKFAADGINRGMERIKNAISWDNVGSKVTYFVNAFTTTFNSLVDNINWRLIGETIGTGINTLVNTLNLLIESINWKNIGTKFADGVNGIVDTVNWNNLGKLIGNKFMIIPNVLLGFVKKLNFKNVGKAVGNALNGIVDSVDLGTLGDLLGSALTGAFDAAISFASTFKWDKLGDNIANGINKFFKNFDGAKFGEAATSLISGLLDTIITAVENTDWEEVWRDIIDFLTHVNWIELQLKLAVAAVNLITGIVTGLIQAIADTDWGDVWDSILQAFRDFFGISSPSTVMAEQGGFLISGLIQGISAMIPDVGKAMEKVKKAVLDAWDGAKKKTTEIWNSIKTGVSSKWEEMKKDAGVKFGDIKKKISDAWEQTKKTGEEKWTAIKQNLSTTWQNLKTNASTTFNNVKTTISNAWQNLKSNTSSAWQGIKTSLQSAWNSIKSSASTTFSNIKTTVSNALSNVGTSISKMKDKFSDALKSAKNYGSKIISQFKQIKIPLPHIVTTWKKHTYGNFWFNLPHFGIEWYKKGGLFDFPSVIGVGEAGKEAVLPLENKKTMAMIADSITQSGGLGLDEDTMANAVARGVAMAMMNNSGNRAPINVYATLYTENDEVLARAVTRGQRSLDYRNNPVAQFG